MGPQNAPMGNNFITDLPTTEVDETAYQELQKTAKFSRTAEFKELKKYLETKIGFYQAYLPSGTPVGALDQPKMSELGYMWMAANVIIGELQAVIDVYENANQQVNDAAAQRKRA